jgi:phytoene synthase
MDPSADNPARIEKAYEYCESVTKLHAKSFHFAAKFLPRLKQRAVYPIYAFCRHVDDEIDELGEDGDEAEALKAVGKWQAKLERVYASNEAVVIEKENNETGDPRLDEKQNLVFVAWRDLLRNYRIPRQLPLDLIKGVVQDTRVKRYESFDELYVYCYRVASTVGLMSSEILGYANESALADAEAMGIAMQLTNILRDVREDASMGRIYLPQEDLRKFGVGEEQIFDGRIDDNFIALMKFEIERARAFYAKGERGIALLEKDSRFTVLLAARIYSKILDQIERLRYDVFARRAHTSKTQKIISIPKIWLEANRM